MVNIDDYEYFLGRFYANRSDTLLLENEHLNWQIHYNNSNDGIIIEEMNTESSIEILLNPFASELHKNNGSSFSSLNLPNADMGFRTENEELEVLLLMTHISGNAADTVLIKDFAADIFVSVK